MIGKEWQRGACGPDKYDCYGLCMAVCRRAGIELPFHAAIENVAERAAAITLGVGDYCKEIDRPKPYCLVVLRIKGYASHVGVVLDDCKRFIHVMRKRRVCVECLNSKTWENKVVGYYEYIGR